MVTSVTMVRQMGSFNIEQRTKDGFFNANSLLAQWNSKEGNSKREMKKFIESPKTIQFINEIENQTPIEDLRLGENKAFHIKKGRNTSKGKTND
jgi:KilA-N domain